MPVIQSCCVVKDNINEFNEGDVADLNFNFSCDESGKGRIDKNNFFFCTSVTRQFFNSVLCKSFLVPCSYACPASMYWWCQIILLSKENQNFLNHKFMDFSISLNKISHHKIAKWYLLSEMMVELLSSLANIVDWNFMSQSSSCCSEYFVKWIWRKCSNYE